LTVSGVNGGINVSGQKGVSPGSAGIIFADNTVLTSSSFLPISGSNNYLQNTSVFQNATGYISSMTVTQSLIASYLTPNQCVQSDATGKMVSSGGTCGGG